MTTPPPTPARHRVAITGMGAVTPLGLDAESTWRAVVSGESGITALDGPEFAGLSVRIGGQVRGFDAARYLSKPLARRLSPVQHWAIAAADEAMHRAGVIAADSPADSTPLPWDPQRFAIIVATGSGPVDAMQAATRSLDSAGERAVPFTLSVYGASDAAAAVLSERYGARGPSQAVSATCASGAMGLGTGLRMIRHGYADAVLVIGMEDCLNPVNLASNARMRALASGYEDAPARASRPFDTARNGFVMSSGAGAVLLESEEAWRSRAGGVRREDGVIPGGAAPLAELAGYGASSDAHHPTAPPEDGHGAAQAVSGCLADAGVASDDIDHINAHGTGTPLGDAAELAGLHAALGERARSIPISATKSSTGHLLGASGVVEAIIAVKTVGAGMLPPTVNLEDSAFPDWDIVAGSARRATIRSALSTSFGFGGHNGAILLRQWHNSEGKTA